MSSQGRGFWLHQLVEYAIAIMLIMMSAQTRQPLVPVLFGVALLINVAVADGVMSAFKLLSRRMHRFIDWAIIIGCLVSVVLVDIDATGRLALLGVALVLAVISLGTNFAKRGADGR
ncbi:MAG: hypothetical protein ACYC06_11800, partial [Ilumatobacteraceae bacterium]